jgi:hypothetical protein
MINSINLAKIEHKEIIKRSDIYDKLENPVTKSLYIYLNTVKPMKINIADLEDQYIKTKDAAFRILMMIATIELQELGFLKDSIHKHDRIELIYA